MVSGMTCFVKRKSCFFTNPTILPIYVSSASVSLVKLVYPQYMDSDGMLQSCFQCLHELIESKTNIAHVALHEYETKRR